MPPFRSHSSLKTIALPRRIGFQKCRMLATVIMSGPARANLAPLISQAQLADIIHLRLSHRSAATLLDTIERGSTRDVREFFRVFGFPLSELNPRN